MGLVATEAQAELVLPSAHPRVLSTHQFREKLRSRLNIFEAEALYP